LTSFDIFEKDVGGVNKREIFLWILWTVGFSFWTMPTRNKALHALLSDC
jgi:hypothetical protein